MFKRTIGFIMFVAMFISPVFAARSVNAQFGFDLRGGACLISPSNFNKNYTNTFEYGFGIPQVGTPLSGMVMGNLNIKYFVMKNLAAYLRTDLSYSETQDVLSSKGDALYPAGDVITNYALFSTLYTGVGAKYYFSIGDFNFFPYVALDLGMNFQMGSYWEVTADSTTYPSLTSVKYSLVDFTDPFVGLNIEIGAEYLFTDNFGINIGGGYKLASSTVTYATTKNGIFNKPNPFTGTDKFNLTEVNLSGGYFLGGVVVHFGGTAERNAPETGGLPPMPGASTSPYAPYAQKYETLGDGFFAQKNYKNALAYYTYAAKYAYAGKLPTAAATYRKVGYCYYYMGDKPKAVAVFKQYLVMNPSDLTFRNWLINYINTK
ncbi:MAG: hypothetical protein WCJ46_06505 [bacterium]